jgi:hypothetical protein
MLSLTICILLLFIMMTIISASGEDKLTVNSIHRISHPAYTMTNIFYTDTSPFNVDYSRVMMYEDGRRGGTISYTTVHPQFPSAVLDGRHMIWGCIAASCVTATPATSTLQALDLDNLTQTDEKLTDWAANTFKLPTNYANRMVWSPYPGETNIVYALNRTTKMIVAYNVDTAVETAIISYAHGASVADAEILGFTKDAVTGSLGHQHEIVVKLVWYYGQGGTSGRFFTDHANAFTSPTATWENIPYSCDAKMAWYPEILDVHGAVSPDGLYYATYWGVGKNDGGNYSCIETDNLKLNSARHWKDDDMYNNQMGLTHVSWFGSNDYFMEGAENTRVFQTLGNYPELITEKVYQVSFNRTLANTRANDACPDCFTHNLLINHSSATIWYSYSTYSCTTSSDCSSHWPYTICGDGGHCRTTSFNYSGMPLPTIGADGLHMYFHGTNGKYTRDDKGECVNKPSMTNCSSIGNNWEGLGAYIADLAPPLQPQPMPMPPTPTLPPPSPSAPGAPALIP